MSLKRECRHFTGIQHKTCAAGVNYMSVRDTSRPGMAKWPCITMHRGEDATTVCPHQSLLTEEEMAAKEARIMAAIEKACADIAAGKCHVCGADAEPSRRDGRCIYNACGHRRGQALDSEDA
jgi:hypothetical protein